MGDTQRMAQIPSLRSARLRQTALMVCVFVSSSGVVLPALAAGDEDARAQTTAQTNTAAQAAAQPKTSPYAKANQARAQAAATGTTHGMTRKRAARAAVRS